MPFRLNLSHINWEQLDPSNINWEQADPSTINWEQADPSKINWQQIDPSRINWEQADPSKINWEQLDPGRIKWEQAARYVELRAAALATWVKTGTGNIVAWLKDQWWYRRLQGFGLSMFMEPPSFTRVGVAYSGEPVYYVNGMLTDLNQATDRRDRIGDHLQRPVHVVYNPTVNIGMDLAECYYDRLWIYDVFTLFSHFKEVSLLKAFLDGKPTLQMNPTTRQVAHLLYHADRPISIVSHSQGCMIVRNACFTLFLLSKESWVRAHLAWIAAGTPLNDNEVWPPARKYESLRVDGDPIARWLALSGTSQITSIPQMSADHDFIQSYIPQIGGRMLWPSGSGTIGPSSSSVPVPILSAMMH